VRLLSTPEELDAALRDLQDAKSYYVDTEFDSSRRGKRLSLIQISAGGDIYLVDALRQPSLGALGDVLCQSGRQWVLHAGLQDVELLLEAFGRDEPPALFDTQVAWGLVGPEAGVSLAFLQFKLLGVRSSKGHQADDWMRRPLPSAQLAYAAQDIAHLPELERELRRRARDLGREDEIHEASREFLMPTPAAPLPLSFDSFRNAWQLDGAGQAALRSLVDWYNALPGSPPGLQSRTLLSIAGRLPTSLRDLARIKGVSATLAREHGGAIVSLMQRARRSADEGLDLEPPAYGSFDDFVAEARLQLIRAETCAELEIAPDVALPMALVKRMNHRVKATGRLDAAAEEIHGWRRRVIGEALARRIERLDT